MHFYSFHFFFFLPLEMTPEGELIVLQRVNDSMCPPLLLLPPPAFFIASELHCHLGPLRGALQRHMCLCEAAVLLPPPGVSGIDVEEEEEGWGEGLDLLQKSI